MKKSNSMTFWSIVMLTMLIFSLTTNPALAAPPPPEPDPPPDDPPPGGDSGAGQNITMQIPILHQLFALPLYTVF